MHLSSQLNSANSEDDAAPGSCNSLWFERFSSRVRLSYRTGIVVVGVLPVVLLSMTSQYLSGGLVTESLLSFQFLNTIGYLTGYTAFIMFASRYIARRTEKLANYSKSMLPPGRSSVVMSLINGLHSIRGVAVTFGLTLLIGVVWLNIVTVPADFFSPATRITEETSMGETMVNLIAVGYLRFIQATFLWTFAYSMYVVYRLGKLPLKTKHFALDRTLGLKPFGTMCFELTTLYLVVTLLTFTFPFFTELSYPSLVMMVGFVLLGVPLFLIPMLTLRSRLVAEKKRKKQWLSERHARTMQVIEDDSDGLIDPKLVNELLAIDKMEKQIQQITTWPVDNSLLVRLTTVFAVPVTLSTTSAVVIQLLGLG